MALFPGLFGPRRNAQQQIADLANQLTTMQDSLTYLSQSYATAQQLLNIQFRAQGGFERFDSVNQQALILDGYNRSSAVYSIISDIAQKAASIPLKVSIIKDETALKNYQNIIKLEVTPDNVYRAQMMRRKALIRVDQSDPLQHLCDHPNPDDDPTLFWQTVSGFRLICGNSYLYTPRLDMGADMGKVVELRIMPSPYTALIVVQGYPPKVIGYELIIAGVQLLQTTEVIHMKYPNYNWTIDGLQLYGLPPLQAAARTLARSNSAETSATAMFENGGPGVIVYNESVPPTDRSLEQASKIKSSQNNQYAGNTNRGKVQYMPGKIGVAELGLDPVSLNILESEKFSFDLLCNAYHLHSVLFNIHVSSNFNNIKELKKDNWTSAYIPERQAHADALNLHVVPGYNTANTKYFVELDLSEIADLQEDKAVQAEYLAKSWWIPPNQKLEAQGLETSTDPNMDKVWMPAGMVTMDDASISVDNIPNMPETPVNTEAQPVTSAQQNGKNMLNIDEIIPAVNDNRPIRFNHVNNGHT